MGVASRKAYYISIDLLKAYTNHNDYQRRISYSV
jgi:hypothetical protein